MRDLTMNEVQGVNGAGVGEAITIAIVVAPLGPEAMLIGALIGLLL